MASNSNSAVFPGSTTADLLNASRRTSAPIYGTAADDVITATGRSSVYAGEGNNVVLTGDCNDVIYAGAGRDIIDAGAGNNTIFAGDGINLITTGSGKDVIYTGSGNDFIDAGAGNNTIFAGEGNNRILTRAGNDVINAGAGNDWIDAGAGNDTIYAGAGNNIISAGTGRDSVFLGSTGNDKLILESGSGSVTVTGFNTASDKLRLGQSLLGQSLRFTSSNGDTQVYAGRDLLATLKGVAAGSQALIDNGPLVRYQATDLGSLSTNPNGSVNAASVNDFGQIAGRYDTGATFTNTNATTGVVNTTNLVRSGFIWENGVPTAITSTGVKKGQSDFGAADGATVTLLTPNVNTISNRGVILGTADEVRQPNPLPTDRALLWQKNGNSAYSLTINDFGGIESYFFDTNNANQIVGRNIIATGDVPITVESGVLTRLADPFAYEGGTARGLNGKGTIVGYVDKDAAAGEQNTAIVWQKDANGAYQATDLGTFGATQATLRDINNAGQIIGSTSTAAVPGVSVATSTPFLLQADGTFVALGSLGGNTGSVNGINEFGQVVGASQTAAGVNHAFVWSNGVLTDLNNLVSAPLTFNGAAVTLTSAVSISNFGEIVATGTYSYQDTSTPTPTTRTGTRSYTLRIA